MWSDLRNSTTPAPTDPYAATTNSDVIVSQSFDAGQSWSAPVALALRGDQFQQWTAYDREGLLRIGTFDRSIDPANHVYTFTVATETASGSLAFTTTHVATETSDPTTGDRWLAASRRRSWATTATSRSCPTASAWSGTGWTCETT